MSAMPEGVQPQDRLEASHVPAQRQQALCLQPLRQGVHPQGSHGEALGHAHEKVEHEQEAESQQEASSEPGGNAGRVERFGDVRWRSADRETRMN